MSDGYISRQEVRKSYRPKSHVMSPGLKRAREPYRVRNAVTGLAIAGFCVGVWAYSISAVKQDVFDDLDEEAKALAGTRTNTAPGAPYTPPAAATSSSASAGTVAASSPAPTAPAAAPPSTAPVSTTAPKGILAALLYRSYPAALDPTQKTLVWGAPPVDKVGRLGEKA